MTVYEKIIGEFPTLMTSCCSAMLQEKIEFHTDKNPFSYWGHIVTSVYGVCSKCGLQCDLTTDTETGR